ncbi:MAG: nitroreductase A [Methanomassiliicoccales archaeon PtaU1.Bin124]|nr:MAG: nitroreductase A [Methanomassiliicoccales archaeon PtaU1.Bin124]
MSDVMKNIYARRSVRAYSEEPVSEDKIREIIKAGFHAPNGAGTEALRFAVITNKARLKHYSDISKVMFVEQLRQVMAQVGPEQAKSFEGMIKTLSNPKFDIFYGAPVLVLVFAAPHAITPVEDASLAAENMMLAATSMGLGSCWIGFAKPLGNAPEVMSELNVPSDHKLIAPLILGVPKKKDMAPSQRPEPQILSWSN